MMHNEVHALYVKQKFMSVCEKKYIGGKPHYQQIITHNQNKIKQNDKKFNLKKAKMLEY